MDYSNNMSIENLGLSTRTYNCLKRNQINTVGEVLTLSEERLRSLKNMGKKSIEEVIAIMEKAKNKDDYFLKEEALIEKETETCFLDASIEEISLSARSLNCLKNNGINTFRQLIWLDENSLASLKNAGSKTIAEIVLSIKNMEDIAQEEKTRRYLESFFPKWISRAIDETIQFFGVARSKAIDVWGNAYNLSETKKIEEVTSIAYQNEFFDILLRNIVLATDTNWNHEFNLEVIKNGLPTHLVYTGVFETKCLKLEEEKKIKRCENGKYRIVFPTIDQFVSEIVDERTKNVLTLKLAGATLNEIGETLCITRERVRQIITKALENHSKLSEDKYIYLFEKYNFTKEDFVYAFAETEQTFYYLEMASKTPNCKKQPLENILNDDFIPCELKEAVNNLLHKNFVYDNGVYVNKTRQEMFKHYFSNTCFEKTPYNEILKGYEEFLEKYGLENNNKLIIEPRTYENALAACNYALANNGRNYRYYDIENPKKDYVWLINELHIEEFLDKEISTLKLFRENPDIMWIFDIHDEYELHNLLKKIWHKYGNCSVNFSKMPTIKVGNVDEKKQMFEFLTQKAPISGDELAKAYEEMYGIKSALAFALYIKNFSEYYNHGMFEIEFEELSFEQFEYMKNELKNDFYTANEIVEIFQKKFPSELATAVNSYTIRQLGYQNYTGYVLRKDLTMKKYSEIILTQKDEFCLDDFHKAMKGIVGFTTVLYEKRAKREIVEFSPNNYVSLKKLVEQGFLKDDLEDYCSSVASFVKMDTFFTVHSLLYDGFKHGLHAAKYGEWFFSSVLVEERKNFSYRRLGDKTRLFCRGKREVTLSAFIEWIVKNRKIATLDELKFIMLKEYGISNDDYEVVESIRKSSLRYNALMGQIESI